MEISHFVGCANHAPTTTSGRALGICIPSRISHIGIHLPETGIDTTVAVQANDPGARHMTRHALAAAIGLFAASSLGAIPVQAQGLVPAPRISAALAAEAVATAVASCAAQGYAETAVLVDTDGVTQAMVRGDGAGIHTIDSAHDKAYTSVTFKSDTMAMLDRAQALNSLVTRLPHMLLAGGGVVIKSGQTVVGAIGAGGAPGFQLDDACAKAGANRIADRLK
jgi:uncharacterized protein GlcG (DUF336 family)